MTFRLRLERLVFRHLTWALKYGWHPYVYRFTSFWSGYQPCWDVQTKLFTQGYEQCPSCLWATKSLVKHMQKNSWCLEYWIESSERENPTKKNFYLLSQDQKKEGRKVFRQIGIVGAGTLEEAAAKIGRRIILAIEPPESCIPYAQLVDNYHLELMPEIFSGNDIPIE